MVGGVHDGLRLDHAYLIAGWSVMRESALSKRPSCVSAIAGAARVWYRQPRL